MPFQSLVAREDSVAFETLTESDLPNDGVLVDVAYSSLNYKDALAVTRRGKIVRRFPMILGIDLAGTTESGEAVLAVGQGLGESDPGGYTTRQRVRADALVPLPDGMTLEQSMQIGTAGFTAMLCVLALEQNNVRPDDREVIVTGAAGGVGSIAVLLLAKLGYRVAASTGRPELADYLHGLGATSIIPRDELASAGAPMQKERWAGGIDTVGGQTLANVFAQTAYEGAVACCGMAGGNELQTTVWPLILRNVSLLGVSSIRTRRAKRIEAWSRLASDIDFAKLAELSRTEPIANIFALSDQILAGQVRGRVVIRPS
jgi:putative YhdH/YhfP family quinone oxidoreductase